MGRLIAGLLRGSVPNRAVLCVQWRARPRGNGGIGGNLGIGGQEGSLYHSAEASGAIAAAIRARVRELPFVVKRGLFERREQADAFVRSSPPPDASFVFLLQHVCDVQVELRSRPFVRAAELGVAPVADGDVFQPRVDHEIDHHGAGQDAVRNEIAAQPVERAADGRADDDDREADLRIEILPRIEIGARTDRASIDGAVRANRGGDGQRDLPAAAAAPDVRRRIGSTKRKRRVTFRAPGENLQGPAP